MVIRLEGQKDLTHYTQAFIDLESDCEGDFTAVGDGAPETEEKTGDQAYAVLTTGSFSAYVDSSSRLRLLRNDGSSSWKSLFFYCCTDVILFAPLRSQGADARLDCIRQHKEAAVPPPCSPKSIHVLASLVRKPPVKRLTHKTDTVNQARDQDPS